MSKKLEDQEVKLLWQEFKSSGCQQVRERLIVNYLPLVKYVVGKTASKLPSHVKAEDMYSTGVIGLIKAIEKYNPEMKNKFETYAILLIRGAIISRFMMLPAMDLCSMNWLAGLPRAGKLFWRAFTRNRLISPFLRPL